jgi:uncharacterized RDD family membrane protein YckC
MTESRVYAHFLWRVVASLIDFVIVMTASLTAGALSVPVLVVVTSMMHVVEPAKSNVYILSGCAIGAIISVAYFAGFESSRLQATPGKLWMGLVVTDMQGKRIGFFRAVVRLIMKALSGSLFGLAYLVCLVTENKQTVHDVVVNTLVWKEKREAKSPSLAAGSVAD